jgi:hypothetical protein
MPLEGQIDPALISTAIHQARDTARQIGDLQAAQARTIRTLETALDQAVNGALKGRSMPADPPRRRTEIRSRIEADDELRHFILARVTRLTFDQVIAEIAATFPPPRRVSRSSLHRWWHRYGKRSWAAQPAVTS